MDMPFSVEVKVTVDTISKYDWLMTLRSGKGGRKKEPN